MIKRAIFNIACILAPIFLWGQNIGYQSFDNFILSNEANSVRLFLQDEQGLMWIGSNNGLYSFDGYNSFPHFEPGSPQNCVINCGIIYENDYLLLGTENGILMYDCKFDQYVPFGLDAKKDVRAMVLLDNDLWLGCADGLYRYRVDKKEFSEVFNSTDNNHKFNIIHSLVADSGYLYIGTQGSLVRVALENLNCERIDNPASNGRMIISMLKDTSRNCIWLGEGSSLTLFDPLSKSFQSVSKFPVVKSIALDADNNVLMGTDNGFYTYNERETHAFVHDSRKVNSLANNVVCAVFKDRTGNVWLGTDNGFSFTPRKRKFEFMPIFEFTGTGVGNQFSALFYDSDGNYWLGGDNGLIRTRNLKGIDNQFRWYEMGNADFHIPHSHVRAIFQDSDKHLWLATDYGICSYDRRSEHFTKLAIEYGSFNANWAYHIMEDQSGCLWISSFNGGLFKVEKDKLLNKEGGSAVVAHYSVANGLNSNHIRSSLQDWLGNVWVLNLKNGINIIDATTGKICDFQISEYTNGLMPTCMNIDSEGSIWIGGRNGIAKIDVASRKVQSVDFMGMGNALTLSVLEVGPNIWCSTTEGLWIVDKNSLSVRRMGQANKVFYSMFHNPSSNKVLLGTIDGVAACSPLLPNPDETNSRLIISSVMANNNRYINADGELSVRYLDRIKLPYNQNNIRIEFTDLQFSKENREGAYLFKLEGDDENWMPLMPNNNALYLSKLKPGNHQLLIARQHAPNADIKLLKTFSITITPPWYLTLAAKVLYLLALAGFVLWSVHFFIQRNRLRFAQIEKEKTIEQTQMKIDFFTNIAHEFKTPLSLIIAPLSRLVVATKNSKEREALEMIQQNAMKLNSLIHQAIEYYRDSSEVPAGILLSRVEFVEFARTIFSTYEENMKDRQISFVFDCNPPQIEVDVDVLKMESILNNLLSNACKYTSAGGTILLSLAFNPRENMLTLVVSDTGIGIPEKDLPYIFQRFFQSQANKDRAGTGIGLYLVKNFAELHGGSVQVVSSAETGTSFTVQIPAIIHSVEEHQRTCAACTPSDEDKPLIVIVEDNYAIANVIYNIFVPEFRCVIAENGKVGLKICTELKPNLVIADVMMPVMDGLEMCKQLKQHVPTSTIPLVLLTAKDDKETELKSIQLQIDAFISKPFDSNILYSRVKQLIETKEQLGRKLRIEKISMPIDANDVSADEQFLSKITGAIEQHIANPDLNVNFLCSEVDLSQKQLYRKIKGLTGLTVVDYIKLIRMKKAAMLLSNKNFTVAEVMYKVGFSSHSYFAKCFSAEFGKTPRQYIDEQTES